MKNYKITSASIPGAYHYKTFSNNQDYCIVEEGKNYIIGMVADGCGAYKNSEVGAKLIPQILAEYLKYQFRLGRDDWKDDLEGQNYYFLQQLTSDIMDPFFDSRESEHEFIVNHFLFTVIGFVIYKQELTVFYAGDGAIMINNEWRFIDQDNYPEFMTYRFLNQERRDYLQFETYPLKEIRNVIIATDGINYLRDSGFDLNKLLDDRYFGDDIELISFLAAKMQKGILKDDTTFVMYKK